MSLFLIVCWRVRTTSKILCYIFVEGWSKCSTVHSSDKPKWLRILSFTRRLIFPSSNNGQICSLGMLRRQTRALL